MKAHRFFSSLFYSSLIFIAVVVSVLASAGTRQDVKTSLGVAPSEWAPSSILEHSKYQPYLLVAGPENEIFYTALGDGHCGRNLYRYSNVTRKEERLSVLACVTELKFAAGKLFVSYKDGGDSRFETWDGNGLVGLNNPEFDDNLADLQFALESLEEKENANFGRPIPSKWSINESEEVAVLFASKEPKRPVFVAHFPWKKKSSARLTQLTLNSELIEDFRFSDSGRILISLRPPDAEKPGELVMVEAGKILKRFGSGKESNPDGLIRSANWSLGSPTSLMWVSGTSNDFVIADEAKPAFYLYHAKEDQFERLGIPGSDIGSIFPFRNGYWITKPQTRGIFYSGPSFEGLEGWKKASTPLAYEELAGKVKPSYYSPPEYRVECKGYSFAVQSGNRLALSFFSRVELVSLGTFSGLVSYDCGQEELTVIAKSFQPEWGEGRLLFELKFGPNDTNVEVSRETEKIDGDRPLLYLFRANALKLVRRSYRDTWFRAVRFVPMTPSFFQIWLNLVGGSPFDDYGHQVSTNGQGWKTIFDPNPPPKKEFILPVNELAQKKSAPSEPRDEEKTDEKDPSVKGEK